MRILRWFVDTWARFQNWYASRRDTIAGLQAEIERLKADHRREVDDLRGQLAIEQKHSEIFAKLNSVHVSLIEAEIAIQKRREADALSVTPKK